MTAFVKAQSEWEKVKIDLENEVKSLKEEGQAMKRGMDRVGRITQLSERAFLKTICAWLKSY